jgi:peptide deformylase
MKNDIVKIVTDLEQFNERVDEITSEVAYETVKQCVSKLKKALYDNPKIAALCAPQIGEKLRLFVVKTSRNEDQRFKVFLNPLIIKPEGLHLSREISGSIPDKEFIIPRRNTVHVAFQAEDGQVNSETYIGPYAEVVQQMIDMLDGITLADYGLDLDDVGGIEAFDNAPNKQKVELMAAYLEYLKSLSKEFKEEVENSPFLSSLNRNIDFVAGVLSGKITLSVDSEDSKKTEMPEQTLTSVEDK